MTLFLAFVSTVDISVGCSYRPINNHEVKITQYTCVLLYITIIR